MAIITIFRGSYSHGNPNHSQVSHLTETKLSGIRNPVDGIKKSVIRKSARMIGCYSGSFPRAIELLKTGKVNTRPLITHEYPLDRAGEAFDAQLNAGSSIKVLIKP